MSPGSVRHVSCPRPPTIESPGAPSCALRKSEPFPPRKASMPGPPVIRSLALPPMIESLPSSPLSTSLPFCPKITSFPPRPLIVSRPLPPQMMSSPEVPFRVSEALVPVIAPALAQSSAAVPTTVVAVAVLFAGLGSAVPEDTVALFVITVPLGVPGLTFTSRVNDAELDGASVAIVQVRDPVAQTDRRRGQRPVVSNGEGVGDVASHRHRVWGVGFQDQEVGPGAHGRRGGCRVVGGDRVIR